MAAPASEDWESLFRDPGRAHAIKQRMAREPWSVIASLFPAVDPARSGRAWAWARALASDAPEEPGVAELHWAPPATSEPPGTAFRPAPPGDADWGPARLAAAARFAARKDLRWDVPLHLAHVWVPTPAREDAAGWSGSEGQTFLLVACVGTLRATLWRATPMGSPVAPAPTREALLAGVERALRQRWGEAFDVRFETAPRAVSEMVLHDRAGTSEAPVTEAALPLLGALAWAASHHDTDYPGGKVFALLHDAAMFARMLGAVERAEGVIAGGGAAAAAARRPRSPVGPHHAHARVGGLVRRILEDHPDRELSAAVEARVRANDPRAAAELVARLLNHVPLLSPRHAPLAELERALHDAAEPWLPGSVGGDEGREL